MKLTYNFVIKKSKKNKHGACPIYLRLSQGGTHKYIATGHLVKESEWNSKKKEVKDSNLKAALINSDLISLQKKITDALSELNTDQRTLTILVEKLNKKELRFKDALQKHIDELSQRGMYDDKKGIKSVGNEILNTYGEDLLLKDLTRKKIIDFRSKLTERNKSSTINRKLKRVKTLLGAYYKKSESPIDGIRPLKEAESRKERLTEAELKKVMAVELGKNTIQWHAKNFFLFSFYSGGLRFGDICRIKFSDIDTVTLNVIQSKNNKSHSVEVSDRLSKIIDHYRDRESTSSYIFPVFDKLDTDDPESERKIISSWNARVNVALKKIAQNVEINKNISMHIARHTFAQFAINNNTDIRKLSKMLGHSDLKITINYLNKITNKEIKEDLDNLFAKLNVE